MTEDEHREFLIEYMDFMEQLIRDMTKEIEQSKFDTTNCKRIICLTLKNHYWKDYEDHETGA